MWYLSDWLHVSIQILTPFQPPDLIQLHSLGLGRDDTVQLGLTVTYCSPYCNKEIYANAKPCKTYPVSCIVTEIPSSSTLNWLNTQRCRTCSRFTLCWSLEMKVWQIWSQNIPEPSITHCSSLLYFTTNHCSLALKPLPGDSGAWLTVQSRAQATQTYSNFSQQPSTHLSPKERMLQAKHPGARPSDSFASCNHIDEGLPWR